MGRIERRRLTLDDCDDRRRDRVQRERAEVEIEFSNPTSGRRKQNESDLDAKKKSYRRRRHEEEPNERERKTTRQARRRDERVLLGRVVDRPGGLFGRPAGRPVSDPPKTTRIGPGAAGARNRQIVNKVSIKNPTEDDGRRIREF